MTGTADASDPTVLQRALAAVRDLRARLAVAERTHTDPIAVVGIGCRFPGGASGPDAFWRLLRDGVDAVGEIPPDRWDAAAYHDPDPDAPGKIATRHGAFLDDVDRFDAAFFRIAPREAVHLDPQQRLLLEVAWDALEHAGQAPGGLDGTRSGVFVGITNSDYAQLIRRGGASALDAYFPTGNALNAAAGRLSYVLGLQGPSVAVDAACASSLVAVHLACRSLRAGECRIALAGGVNLILAPDAHVAMSRAHALALDGRCKTFDASADGYGRGEGCGVVVLKRLSDAVADGDRVLAVLRGSAVLHDGRSAGLTVPNGAAQQAVIRAALKDAGLPPSAVTYVEAHGTGTALGDPIEVRALGAVLGEDRTADRPLVLGSVKTNIGHLESAAGVASLIKAVLAVHHREIPPHLHLRTLNPDVAQEPTPKLIPTAVLPWPEGAPRVAGVSAFGLSGTIAHVVVEEAPARAESATAPAAEDGPWVLPISAHTPEALRALATAHHDRLSGPDAPPVRDLCYTAAVRRSHHDHRLAVVGASHAELADGLGAFLDGEARPGLTTGVRASRKLVFVFPGQGGQWPGMGRDLLAREPVFADAIAACEAALRPHVAWSLREVLAAELPEARLEHIDVLQPALFSIQVALAALWRSWGVEPDAVVGHSMGELAAAHVAGALSLEDAARVMAVRSQLLRRISGRGAMAVVELPLDEARAALAGREHLVSVAASNGPSSTVLSGDPSALSAILERLTAKDVFCRAVKVDVASHSPQVEPLRADLEAALSGLSPRTATIPFHSTVTGAVADGRELDGGYWVANLRQPVLFAPVADALAASGHDLFVELAPHPTLAVSIREFLDRRERAGAVLPSLRREEPGRNVLLASLGALYAHGRPVDWARRHPAGGRCVPLPAYPWQRERFWVDAPPDAVDPGPRTRATGTAALLGDALRSPALEDAVFASEISVAALPFLEDHRIAREVVVPGASHVVRALCAARSLFGPGPCTIEDVTFPSALVLADRERRSAQLIVKRDGTFRTVTAPRGREDDEAAWTVHAVGRLRRGATLAGTGATLDDVRARCPEEKTGAAFYDEMSRAGYHLGPTFQWLESVRCRDGEALGRLRTPRREDERADYPIDPGLLDSCFQLLAAASRERGAASMAESGAIYVPVGLTHLRFLAGGAVPTFCHVVIGPAPAGGDAAVADIRVLDESGAPLVDAGFRAKRVERDVFVHGARPRPEPLFRVDWEPAAREPDTAISRASGGWILIADETGTAARLARELGARGAACTTVRADEARSGDGLRRAIEDAARTGPMRGVIHLAALDAPAWSRTTASALEEARARTCETALHAVQAIARAALRDAPRLWFVTAGAQAAGDAPLASPAQATLWGLARVIGHEHPDLRCTCVDLGADAPDDHVRALAEEVLGDGHEDQIALRGGARLVARLARHVAGARPAPAAAQRTEPAGDRPFRLEIDTPGVLENLVVREVPRPPPGPGEVELEVRAAGINFVDVLSAMGIRPDHTEGPTKLGGECAGVVTAVGPGVTEFREGDEVIAAIVPHCFRSFVVVPTRFVVRKPEHIGFEDAATLPITFMTAHWAMHHKARLAPGERILIHAAAGGVGLAAVQLARRAGAEIFATAGSEAKREYLRRLGIEHVMDSRSLAFADEIRRRTGGEGVDVVLNCLTGDALAASVSVLRAHGRFLEIGKRDIYDNNRLALYPFHQNLSYFAIDLIRMFGDRPDRFAELLGEIVDLVDLRELEPLTWRAFPVSRAMDAFRHLAQAQHVGKVVLTFPDPEARISPAAPPRAGAIRPDASYLVTGGLGGLGLEVARWLVARGARHLVLAGRREPSRAAQDAIATLEAAGAHVLVAPVDVARPADVERMFARIDAELPPLRGVVHAAGVLDDGVLLQQTPERFAAVMAPKVAGSWNLHVATRERTLDFFVLFSGAGTLLGSPGQGNYAAANAFLDALAQARHAEGLPAQSIAWGPWSDVGLAATAARGGRLALSGVGSLAPREALAALERVMKDPAPQLAVVPLDLKACFEAFPALANSPFLSTLARDAGEASVASTPKGDAPFRRTLLDAPDARRPTLIETHLREQAARVLGLAPGRIDPRKPLGSLGFDSLMTLELRNRLEASLGLKLSATVVWNHPTIAALSEHLLRRIDIDTATPPPPPSAPPDRPDERPAPDATADAVAVVEALTEEQAAAALAEKLTALDQRSR
jgi:acyl transferase domain-containing protein/acyl carrier protein